MSRINLIKAFGSEDVETFNKCSTAYEMGRADERNNVLSTLSKLIESDYNSKECKLMLADLCEMLLEQLKED